MKSHSEYSLAIHPNGHTIELVHVFKKRLEEKLDRSYASVNSLGHITLISFQAYDEDYPVILAEFKRVLSGLSPFDVDFLGFGDFPQKTGCTFYIKPTGDTANIIRTRCKKIGANFSKYIKRHLTIEWKIEGNGSPHMSVGNKLEEAEIPECYVLFDEPFAERFHCNSFVIRKLNNKKGQYDIIDTIPLLDHEYIIGQQMQLF